MTDQMAAALMVQGGRPAADEILGAHVPQQRSGVAIAHPVDNVMRNLDLRRCSWAMARMSACRSRWCVPWPGR